MRYKGSYSPTFILGTLSGSFLSLLAAYNKQDPERLEWSILDEEHRKKLDDNHYFCLSQEQRRGISKSLPVTSEEAEQLLQSKITPSEDLPSNETTETSDLLPSDTRAVDEVEFELDSQCSDDDLDIPPGSLLHYNIPGVLRKDEVERLDLHHWKFVLGNELVDFEVRIRPPNCSWNSLAPVGLTL